MRCDVHGTSRHVTIKSSIRELCAFYKSGAYARESSVSYPGRPARCSLELREERSFLTVMQESAEGIVGGSHRRPERFPEEGIK